MATSPEPIRMGTSPLRADPRLGGNALAIVSMLLWATAFPVAEVLLADWDPLFLITARFAIVMAFLIPLWVLAEGWRTVVHARWRRAIFVGGLGFGLGAYLLVLAQWLTDPVTVAIVIAATPIAATLIEIVLDGRRLHGRYVAGLGAAVIGGAVASGGAAIPNFGFGALICLASGALFSWGGRAAVREFPEMTTLGRTTITFAGGLLFTAALLALSVMCGVTELPGDIITRDQFSLLLIYGVVSMAASQFFYLGAVARMGIALTSFHFNAAPFYVMILMLALGAAWSWPQAIGAAIVCIGVLVAQRKT